MNQHPYFMDIHASHKRNDIERSLARANLTKELRTLRGPAQSATAPLTNRSLPTAAIEGFARSLRVLVRGWTLALRGRAVA